MFDFAWSELVLIAVVALVFIPPKDLPRAMRTAGSWIRKARAIAHEFQGNVEQMLRDAELDEVRREVEKATQFDVGEHIANTIDPDGELHAALSEPSALSEPAALPPAAPALPAPPEAAAVPAEHEAAPTPAAADVAPTAAPAERKPEPVSDATAGPSRHET